MPSVVLVINAHAWCDPQRPIAVIGLQLEVAAALNAELCGR